MGAAIRMRCATGRPPRLTIPCIDAAHIEAGRRLDALEILIWNEPDPHIRMIYVRRFNDLWETMTGGTLERMGEPAARSQCHCKTGSQPGDGSHCHH